MQITFRQSELAAIEAAGETPIPAAIKPIIKAQLGNLTLKSFAMTCEIKEAPTDPALTVQIQMTQG